MDKINLLHLVQQTIEEMDQPGYSLTSVVRKAVRISSMQKDYFNQWWLENELVPYGDNDAKERIKIRIAKYISKDKIADYQKQTAYMYQKSRKQVRIKNNEMVDTGSYNAMSVKEIEQAIVLIDNYITSLIQQINNEDDYSHIKKSKQSELISQGKNILLNEQIKEQRELLQDYKRILDRIEHRVFSYLSNKEKQLFLKEYNTNVFDKYQQQVDTRLISIAPDAMEQLRESYKRVDENNAEAWSQAAVSCRRVLKTLADIVYPSVVGKIKCNDGNERVLDDANFKNRLWEYVSQKISGTKTGELLLVQLNDLGNRIDRLYDLSSKGTHDKINKNEIYQCIIQTYLTVGDILFLYDK